MNQTETPTVAGRYHLDIAEMTAGTRVDGTYALINPQISASRTGKTFLKCMLRDASGQVSGRKWSIDERSISAVLNADFAWVSGSCENFNDHIQVKPIHVLGVRGASPPGGPYRLRDKFHIRGAVAGRPSEE